MGRERVWRHMASAAAPEQRRISGLYGQARLFPVHLARVVVIDAVVAETLHPLRRLRRSVALRILAVDHDRLMPVRHDIVAIVVEIAAERNVPEPAFARRP